LKREVVKMKVIAVSGGFDPLHVGHVRMLEEAKALGDKLIVILGCDDFLLRKKGYFLMSEEDRKEILEKLRCVDEVYIHHTETQNVIDALKILKPDVFANGGDRTEDTIPEIEICKELGIELVFGVGPEKIRSSSEMIADAWRRKVKN